MGVTLETRLFSSVKPDYRTRHPNFFGFQCMDRSYNMIPVYMIDDRRLDTMALT